MRWRRVSNLGDVGSMEKVVKGHHSALLLRCPGNTFFEGLELSLRHL